MPTKEQYVKEWRADFERDFEAKYAGRKVLKTARHVIGYGVARNFPRLKEDEAYFAWNKYRAQFMSWAKRKGRATTWETAVEWCATVSRWN